MNQLICFNKPYQVLSQFTDISGRRCLADYIHYKGFYPAGRLDYDSEGLLLLTNDGALQSAICQPQRKIPKTYWAQVEGVPPADALLALQSGLTLKDGLTEKAEARIISSPSIWDRQPPIRERKHIPTTWMEITITEGRNRQVRRMTAAIGHPTLRLIRSSIGPWSLKALKPGEWRMAEIPKHMLADRTEVTPEKPGKRTALKKYKEHKRRIRKRS